MTLYSGLLFENKGLKAMMLNGLYSGILLVNLAQNQAKAVSYISRVWK